MCFLHNFIAENRYRLIYSKMIQIKKKQHYVWQEYLIPWSKSGEQIYTLLKSQKKIIITNFDRVAQEKFFYELEEFTEEEEIILKELVEQWSNDSVRELNLEFYAVFTSYSKIKRALKGKDTSKLDEVELEKKLNLLKANAIEDSHLVFENLGKKIINIKKFEDLKFLENENELLFTMNFLAFQYLRTKKMREVLKLIIPKYNFLSNKFLNMFPFIYSTSIANGLTYDKNVKFIYFENNTEIDFLTSDQPIINEKKHIINDIGKIAQLDFYYPINPKTAIVIHYQEQKEKYKHVLIEKEDIIKYNDLIFENSNEFIFSKTKKQLEKYLNSL